MTSSISEFLTENRQRRYPLTEACSVLDQTETYEIPNDFLLDFRGFHRARNELRPRLAAIVGSAVVDDATYPATTGSLTVYFEVGIAATPLRFSVLIPESTLDPVTESTTSIADPFYPDFKFGTVRATFGPARLLFDRAARWVFAVDTALLEPCLTIESYRSQIDYLRLIHQEGETEYLQGDVKLYGGYNFSVTTRGDRELYLSAEIGAGELGRFTGTVKGAEEEYCTGAVMFINGAGTKDGKMTFEAGPGFRIVPLPDEHKIQLVVSAATLQRPLCA